MDWYDAIKQINDFLHPLIWGWPILAAILLAGANYSFRSGFFQFTHCRLLVDITLCSLFRKKKKQTDGISPFQALTTALAGSIGTGNIVGVATAISIGGAGAIFWMWISALFGMMTIFAETVLGMKYRQKNTDGTWRGGAMYYLEHGVRSKGLAVLFSIGCVLASFGMGNMAQSNSIAGALEESFGTSTFLTGVVLAVLLLVVTFGGIRRIASVTEKLVPFMALGYLAAAGILLFFHRHLIGAVLVQIVEEAFGLRQAVGGIGGAVMLNAMKTGVSRGIFTNEAGLGSSVMAHASSTSKEPVEQGMWGIFQVFLDTILMCTITALVILTSGTLSSGKEGAALSAAAFSTVFGDFGGILIAICLALFAFATLLGWSFYGECGVRYLLGGYAVPLYRIVFACSAVIGCTMDLRLVWDICDTFNGIMAFPNLIALFLLSGEVLEEIERYLKKHKKRPDHQTELKPKQKSQPIKERTEFVEKQAGSRKSRKAGRKAMQIREHTFGM